MENLPHSLSPCFPGQLPAAAVGGVEPVHRSFLKILESKLAEVVHSSVSAAHRETRQGVMASTVSEADSGCFLVVLDVTPSSGYAALSLPSELMRGVLDILLGKPPDAPAARQARITEIELHILKDFFEAFTSTLRKAWAPAFAISFNRLSFAVDDARQILETCSGDAVLILGSRLKVAGVDYDFDLALPGFLIRMVEARANAAQTRERVSLSADAVIAGPLGAAMIELEGVLRGVTLRMGDLLALKPEQTLLLDAPEDARFVCLANGKAQFTGEMQAGSNRHCFQVEAIDR